MPPLRNNRDIHANAQCDSKNSISIKVASQFGERTSFIVFRKHITDHNEKKFPLVNFRSLNLADSLDLFYTC